MIDFGMLNTNTNPMGDMLRGSQITAELKKAQNQYNVQDALYQLSQKPNPTYQDYEGIMNNYPQLAEVVKAPMANIDEKRRRVAEQNFAPVMAAAQNGRLDHVGDLLKKQEEAYINSGDSENAQAVQTMRKMFELDPAVGKTTLGLMGMAVAPDTMKSIFAQSQLDTQNLKNTAQAGQALAAARKADIEAQYTPAQTQAEIDAKAASAYAARTRGDYDAAQRAQLPYKQAREDADIALRQAQQNEPKESVVKLINESVTEGRNASNASREIGSLISLLQAEKSKMGGNIFSGGGTSWTEVFNNLGEQLGGGTTTNYKTIRQEFEKVKNSGILSLLPPGAASDNDIKIFSKGFPAEGAPPEEMLSFLRGAQKLKILQAQEAQHRADWVQQNRTLGRATSDFTIGGRKVGKGQTFEDYVRPMLDLEGTAVEARVDKRAGQVVNQEQTSAVRPNFLIGGEPDSDRMRRFQKQMVQEYGLGE